MRTDDAYILLLNFRGSHIFRSNSKYLWKRIPQTVKTAYPELGHIWAVGQKIWLRDFPGIYETMKKEYALHEYELSLLKFKQH